MREKEKEKISWGWGVLPHFKKRGGGVVVVPNERSVRELDRARRRTFWGGVIFFDRESTFTNTNVVREPPRELRPERIPRRRVGKLENVPEVCGASGRRDAERTRARNGRRNDLESEGKRGKSRGRSESDGGEDDGRGGEENTTTTTKDVTLRKDAYERERRKTRASTGTRTNRHKRRRLFKTQT